MKIITIGVYGFNKDSFFKALLDAEVDTFCDLRLRRGMRGSEYAFVNSEALQEELQKLTIQYIHAKYLAPTQEIRKKQKQEDERLGIAKRSRKALGNTFIQEYEQQCLSDFSSEEFIQKIGPQAQVMSLFCVEREPEACHRLLVANRLSKDLGFPVVHIKPDLVYLGN